MKTDFLKTAKGGIIFSKSFFVLRDNCDVKNDIKSS